MPSKGNRRQQSHDAIVRAAARAFRKLGYPASGVDGIMAEASLTHGGFYAHFDSKEHLFAEALWAALVETQDAQFARLDRLSGAAWAQQFVAFYLSPSHYARVADGCPVPALAADVSRAGPEVRAVLGRGIQRLVDQLTTRTGAASERADDAILALVAMSVGGLVLARALEGTPLADRVLAAVTRFVATELGPAAPDSPFHSTDPGGSA